jgi:CheY-like chemotaxis protein
VKILIVENEIYLAQSIAAKLSDHGYKCELAASVKDAMKDEQFDAVLLSTSMGGQNFMSVVEHYKNSIVILMVSYMNNDTVSSPLKAGAKDYIMKPFMMEELIKKINHHIDFERISSQNTLLKGFLNDIFSPIGTIEIAKKLEFPLLIATSSKKHADAYAYRVAESKRLLIKSIIIDSLADIKKIKPRADDVIYYIQGAEKLKKNDKNALVEALKGVVALVHHPLSDIEWPYKSVTIETGDSPLGSGEILTVEEYVKSVLESFQDRYPDIELAKKLGISRKSLWEKRKKHGINKKK